MRVFYGGCANKGGPPFFILSDPLRVDRLLGMKTKPRLNVGVYINDTKADTLRIIRCLQEWNLSFTPIWRDDLAGLEPGDADVLLLHGGWYGIDRVPPMNQNEKAQQPEHRAMERAVKNFVSAGGGIVGICCGAFNVVWLNLIEAGISRTQGVGPHALETVNDRHPICRGVIQRTEGRKDRKWKPIPVNRINGPIFFPKKPAAMVFSYDWEHRLGAVLAGEYGRGRAVAISPHPERTARDVDASGLEPMPLDPLMPVSELLKNALNWAAGRG